MEYNPSNEEHRDILDYLISEGAASLSGIDEDGEPVYVFDMDVLEEVMPELHAVVQDDMDKVLVDLYQRGLIDISYDEDLNALISVSDEGRQALIEEGFDPDLFQEDIE